MFSHFSDKNPEIFVPSLRLGIKLQSRLPQPCVCICVHVGRQRTALAIVSRAPFRFAGLKLTQ